MAPAGRAAADSASDRAVAQQIAQDLKQSGQLRDYRVAVKYQDGVAWLTGTVTSAEQKQTAERLARQSRGVDRVVSRLEIAGGEENVQQAGGVSADDYGTPLPAARPATRPQGAAAQRQAARAGGNNMPLPYART
ncbi:MAG TPA: BON domain-containing protein, partial [Lacipirellulaceae bacterium]|nr:BON domain-containing protein [Lacipirellulaceae bacterium]